MTDRNDERLDHLATLRPDWCGEGAKPLRAEFIAMARPWVHAVAGALNVPVHLYPTPIGGVQIEWDGQYEVEIIDGGETLSFLAFCGIDDNEHEGGSLDALLEWIGERP